MNILLRKSTALVGLGLTFLAVGAARVDVLGASGTVTPVRQPSSNAPPILRLRPVLAGTSPGSTGTVFNYDLVFVGGTSVPLRPQSFVTLYDVRGLVSATASGQFHLAVQNVGRTPSGTTISDDPALPNVTVVFNGDAPVTSDRSFSSALRIVSTSSTQALGRYAVQLANIPSPDGTGNLVPGPTAEHQVMMPGVPSANVTPDPASSTNGAFASAISTLASTVSGMGLEKGITTALSAKLQGAREALNRNQKNSACTALQDFLNQAGAQSGKKISTAQAAQLTASATSIRAQAGC